MSGNLLDTNIIIDWFRGDEKTISFLNNFDFEIPVIVIGELFYVLKILQKNRSILNRSRVLLKKFLLLIQQTKRLKFMLLLNHS